MQVLWRTIVEVDRLLDARPASNDLVLKSAHALAQLANSYASLTRATDLEARVKRLEEERHLKLWQHS